MLAAYTFAVGLSAALLFVVQPMVGKMLLPLAGGSPAAWTTCMLFFQTALLCGYAWADLLARRLEPRKQCAAHAVVLALALAFLPVSVGGPGVGGSGAPTPLSLLLTLAAAVGAPFFVLSATGPLLQRWLALTDHPDRKDPYFLYAASNLGSLGGLLVYPFVLEPALRLRTPDASLFPPRWLPISQSTLWSVGYVLLAGLVMVCGLLMIRRTGPPMGATSQAADTSPSRRGALYRWLILSLVPSSAMLGVTQYLTTDVAAVPMLWVLPLAVYLLTFVLAFSRAIRIPAHVGSAALLVSVVGIAASMLAFRALPVWLMLALHLTGLFFVGLVCHGRLAAERPAPARLTRFYLVAAIGGALGGVINALVAPLVFDGVWEYPIALVLACALRPVARQPRPAGHAVRERALDVAVPACVAALLVGLYLILGALGLAGSPATTVAIVAVAAAAALLLMGRPVRSAIVVTLLFVAAGLRDAAAMETLYDERTFFGVHRVVQFEVPFRTGAGRERITRVLFRVLYHGATRHGTQILDPGHRRTATTYYHHTGPIGQVFELFGASRGFDDVALIGLGAGTLAAYGRPSQRFTVYELDPEVIRIASDPELFTFLSDSAAQIGFVEGDGRLSIANAPDGAYGLIVADAFSSDAIPVHLLTREAVTLYFDKLREDGILAIHITNRHVSLEPVVRAIAIELGLAAIVRTDGIHTEQEKLEGKYESTWALLARRPAALGPLWNDPAWRKLQAAPGTRADDRYLWTDDYSNVLSLIDL